MLTKSMDHSKLEALPYFDYVLTIIINNVWTCMAVLTAGAFSFIWTTNKSWSLRFQNAPSPSVSSQKSDMVHSFRDNNCLNGSDNKPVAKNIVPTPGFDCTDEVIKRGKFVVYYFNDDEVREEDYNGNVVREEALFDDVPDGVKFCCRELNMGWYRYVDLTVFSGNVVRLWD